MILDKIENSKFYYSVHKGFYKAFEYILKTDFSILADGKYEIEGEKIFALVQQYKTKDRSEAKLEAHKKYIDIQFISSGVELIGVSILNQQKPVINEPEKDIAFYDGKASFLKLEEGMFAVFFPHDMHMPGIKLEESALVKKIVIKVLV